MEDKKNKPKITVELTKELKNKPDALLSIEERTFRDIERPERFSGSPCDWHKGDGFAVICVKGKRIKLCAFFELLDADKIMVLQVHMKAREFAEEVIHRTEGKYLVGIVACNVYEQRWLVKIIERSRQLDKLTIRQMNFGEHERNN